MKKTSNKINLGYPKSEFKNIATNSQLREVLSIDYQYGIQFRNAFHSLLILIPGVNGKQKTGKVQNVVASSYGHSVKHRPALEMKALCAADLSRISGYSKKVGTSSKKNRET